jgi:cell wall-associated NlpC family hydrolase
MGKTLKGAASMLTGMALAASITAVATPAASAATTCSASFTTYQTIRQGSRGGQATAVECLLRNAGFASSVNGSFSANDAAQLSRFRTSVGMSPLKAAGPRTWAALIARGSTPALHNGDRGAAVLRLQRSLRALGWTGVQLSGRYDSATVSAVKAVQKWRKQSATGTSTDAVWRDLQNGRVAKASAVTSAVRKAALAKKVAAQKVAAKRASANTTSRGAKALAFAKRQIGDRYRYGATGPSAWDCSGLTQGAYKAAGKRIPRTSQAQFRAGKKVSKSNLKKGDLVFFYRGITHVGIYAGNGYVVHASRPSKPVGKLKMKYMPYQGARRY